MSQHAGQQDLEQRIAQALDCAPQVSIPQGFAARMAAQLPQQAEVRLVCSTYARRFAVVCAVLLAVGLLVLAVQTPATFTLSEMLFAVELGLLTLWLVAYRRA